MGGHSNSSPPGYQSSSGGPPTSTDPTAGAHPFTGTPLGTGFPGSMPIESSPLFTGTMTDPGGPAKFGGSPFSGMGQDLNQQILKYLQGQGAHAPNGGPLVQNGQFMPPWGGQSPMSPPGGQSGGPFQPGMVKPLGVGMPNGNVTGMPAGQIVPNANTPSTNNYDPGGIFNKPQNSSPSWMSPVFGSSPPSAGAGTKSLTG